MFMMEEKQKSDIFPCRVVEFVDQETLVINRGKEHGISIGQRFVVYALGKEIIDPENQESLGRLELIRGTGKVTNVQAKIATITSDMTKTQKKFDSMTDTQRALSGFLGRTSSFIQDELVVPFDSPRIGDLVKPKFL
ncbi:MAG: hypothetical protein ACK5T0_04330 [Vampirovibrionales bacterium]